MDMKPSGFACIEAVVGERLWNSADFTNTSGIQRVGGNKKDVFTCDRQPKAAAHALRQRWREDL
jgi:beta-glucuronidase